MLTQGTSSSTAPTAADQHFAVLEARIQVEGKAILDMGCGSGDFLKLLRGVGAKAFGLEVNDAAIMRALDTGIDPALLFLGDGRSLPFDDNSLDMVSFVNSFHHVPGNVQQILLEDVARVLKSGGELVAFEPRPKGAMTEVISPIEDETEVRTNAQSLLSAPPIPFTLLEIVGYETERYFASMEDMIRKTVAVDPERDKLAQDSTVRQEVEKRFNRLAEYLPDGIYRLKQPSVFFRLRNG